MARPPRQDPATTRSQILAIARRDVLAGGMQALSLRSIARELGYSPGSLYKHFDSRDAILAQLASDASAIMREGLAEAPRGEPREHPVVAMGLTYVRTCRRNPDDLALAGILRTRTSLEQDVPKGSPYKLILEVFEEAAARGEVHAVDSAGLEAMAYGVWAMVEGIVELRRTHLRDFDADLDAADRMVLRALVRGYESVAEDER